MPNKFITGYWGHLFADDKSERMTKIFAHADTGKIIAAQVQRHRGLADDLGYVPANADEIACLEDSLINANAEALENPEDYGLEFTDAEPDWIAK